MSQQSVSLTNAHEKLKIEATGLRDQVDALRTSSKVNFEPCSDVHDGFVLIRLCNLLGSLEPRESRLTAGGRPCNIENRPRCLQDVTRAV